MLSNEITVAENMESKKTNKIRNPFPMIGKVFKYEFISTLRVFGPLYIAMILLGVIMGFFFLGHISGNNISDVMNENYSNGVVEGLFFTFYFLLVAASWIVTFVLLEKRFKKGMLGDEAYLNMTLPVTVGEHLCGRVLVAFVWIILCGIAVALSGFMLAMGAWKELFTMDWSYISQSIIEETGHKFISLLGMGAGIFLTFLILAITFVYVVNAVGNLAKKGHTIVEIIVAVALLFVYSQVSRCITFNEDMFGNVVDVARVFVMMGVNVLLSVINLVATQLILTLKLNLE